MPVSGEVLEFNSELESSPELVNSDPYGKGWLVKVRVTDLGDKLLTADEYKSKIGG